MANYLDGMEGGKHNSDNCEATFTTKKVKMWTDEMGTEIYPFQPALSTKMSSFGKPKSSTVHIPKNKKH